LSDLFWLTDEQMARLQPYFPKSHGRERVDDRRGLSEIIFANRNGLRWRDAPKDYGPHKTCTIAGSGGATKASKAWLRLRLLSARRA
jgi:transposase